MVRVTRDVASHREHRGSSDVRENDWIEEFGMHAYKNDRLLTSPLSLRVPCMFPEYATRGKIASAKKSKEKTHTHAHTFGSVSGARALKMQIELSER